MVYLATTTKLISGSKSKLLISLLPRTFLKRCIRRLLAKVDIETHCFWPISYYRSKGRSSYDRNLLLSLVYDAKVTEWFAQQIPSNPNTKESGKQFKQDFGMVLAFMATHSGLTRWQDFSPVDEDMSVPEDHFSICNCILVLSMKCSINERLSSTT